MDKSDSLLPYDNWMLDRANRHSAKEPITEKQLDYIRRALKNSAHYSLEAFEEVIGVPLEEMKKSDGMFIIECLVGVVKRLKRCRCGKPGRVVVSFAYAYSKAFCAHPVSLCVACVSRLTGDAPE
jgi:hypothetical protein